MSFRRAGSLMAMRLNASMYITLDGVIQGGGGPDEDRSGDFRLGGWMAPYLSEDSRPIALDRLARADAFLLGRTTYDLFAGYWPRLPDDNPFARALNHLPKYVVSTTLKEPTWAHT